MPSPVQDLPERARRGIRTLLVQQAILQSMNVVGGVIVARRLGPGPLGVFGIVVFVVTVAGLLTDVGLKTALIRRAAAVTERDLVTSFTLRQLLVTAMVALLVVSAPAIATLYPLIPTGELAWLLRLLAFDLYLLSWRATSEVPLERDLRFDRLATADVLGVLAYQLVSLGLVLRGGGAESLVYGVLASSVVRTMVVCRAAPFPIRLEIDRGRAYEQLRVGSAVQASTIVGQLPAWVAPTLVAGTIGPEAVGLLNWAAWIARKPLEVLEQIVRVSLTHCSRLQHDASEIERVFVRYATAALLVCGLWLAVLGVAGRDLVAFIYTDRWVPAVPALIVYAAAAWVAALRWITATAVVSAGHLRLPVRVTTATSILAVVASLVLVARLGPLGVPLAQLIEMLIATPWLLRGFPKGASPRVLGRLRWVIVPAVAALALGGIATQLTTAPAVRGFLTAAVATSAYACAVWWTAPAWLWQELKRWSP